MPENPQFVHAPGEVTPEYAGRPFRRVGPRSTAITAPRRDRRRVAEEETGSEKPLLWRLVALLLLTITFVAPRITQLDRLVTPDEPIWLARSANFYEAISSGDLASTYQFAHPGVTVMWLGAAGYVWKANDYADRIDGQIPQRLNQVASVLEELGYVPLDVMVAGRIMIVLALTAVFAASFLLALRLFAFWVAVLGFLIVALDPYPIALSRLLHIDATAAYFMLLSVLAGLVYVFRGRKRIDLLVSGTAAGLAALTRSQMGVLAIWFALVLLIDARSWQLAWGGWTAALRVSARPLILWGGSAFITCVVLWPALWVDPVGTVKGMLDFAETAAVEGHELTIVFAGQLYEGDPGFKFYPTTFLWRSTPPVIAGVGLAFAAVILARRFGVTTTQRRIAMSIMLAMVTYGTVMSFAAKKFDRYLLPVYPLAAILAAWGLLIGARKLSTRVPGPAWAPAVMAVALTVFFLTSGVRATAPYYLSYYNPMLGGTARAPESMMVGWGEGLDQVGASLDSLPESSSLVAATEVWPSSLSYFFDGDTRIAAFVDDPRGVYRWSRSDYYVLYVSTATRGEIYEAWLEETETKQPVMTVTLNGLEYAQLYDIRDDTLPLFMEEGRSGMVIWENLGRMVASTKADFSRVEVPGSVIDQTLYFDQLEEDLAVIANRYSIRLVLTDARGAVVQEIVQPLQLEAPVRHGQSEVNLAFSVPSDVAYGEYTLAMELYMTDTAEPVQGFNFRYGERLAATVVLDTIQIVAPEDEAGEFGEAA